MIAKTTFWLRQNNETSSKIKYIHRHTFILRVYAAIQFYLLCGVLTTNDNEKTDKLLQIKFFFLCSQDDVNI